MFLTALTAVPLPILRDRVLHGEKDFLLHDIFRILALNITAYAMAATLLWRAFFHRRFSSSNIWWITLADMAIISAILQALSANFQIRSGAWPGNLCAFYMLFPFFGGYYPNTYNPLLNGLLLWNAAALAFLLPQAALEFARNNKRALTKGP